MKRERRWLVLKAGISLALLGFLLSRVDREQMGALLGNANPWLLALAFGCTVLAWLLNTLKWQQLLKVLGHTLVYQHLLALNYIGMFYSLVLPGQISGEVIKGIRLTQAGSPAAHAVVSIAVDRLTGLVALGTFGLVGLLAAPPVGVSRALLWVSVAVVALATVPFLLMLVRPGAGPALLPDRGPLGYAKRAGMALWQGLALYKKSLGALAMALLQAGGFQGLVTLSNYLVALGVGVAISPWALLWIVALVSLVHMAPISFAGLGVREGAYVFLLHQYDVPLANGLSLSLTVSAIILLQGVLGGALEVLSPKLEIASS